MIPVTKPFLPNKNTYQKYVDEIFIRNWLTNNGPLVNELELRLKKYLGLKHLLYVTNGTSALQLAIKCLGVTGEVITTPFSYIATTSSLLWEGCTPVFADIEEDTFNIDPSMIEPLITENTTAILATHVFGNPCSIEKIDKIALKYDLKVIYDAAHCFGVEYNGQSIFGYGDVSTASFHATKIFHTIEGGAVITNQAELTKDMAFARNFGHLDFESFYGVGVNMKNSEFHAAMGLAVLEQFEELLKRREDQFNYYNELLSNLNVKMQKVDQDKVKHNHSYYPIIFQTEELLLKSLNELENSQIFARRYFYPSLNTLQFVDQIDCPISESISKRILCLPLYHTLSKEEQGFIARILLRVQNNPS